ncbi:hypothetical protein SEA_JONJAMES_185 [Gordonia Phage JonJames]|nr:hypothetical protein SEA_JONJAMES_185 [Gordonia Phage JonJames]
MFGHWDEDPNFPVSDWQEQVANGDTRQGYWDWVEYTAEQEAIAAEPKGDKA